MNITVTKGEGSERVLTIDGESVTYYRWGNNMARIAAVRVWNDLLIKRGYRQGERMITRCEIGVSNNNTRITIHFYKDVDIFEACLPALLEKLKGLEPHKRLTLNDTTPNLFRQATTSSDSDKWYRQRDIMRLLGLKAIIVSGLLQALPEEFMANNTRKGNGNYYLYSPLVVERIRQYISGEGITPPTVTITHDALEDLIRRASAPIAPTKAVAERVIKP